MSNIAVQNPSHDLTPEQMELIKSTIAKNATNDELKLFLYRCKHMGFDPLKPGQIHFIKYKDGAPGTIVIGIDGFRSKAAQSGKHSGTKRGVLRDEKGKCVGAWCEVYRSDWQHPARVEVSLNEYFKPGQNGKKSQWEKMPESMIQKVAEVAALRMAFPDQLGGIYSDDEMSHAEKPEPKQIVNHALKSAQHQGAQKAQALRESVLPPVAPPPDVEPFTDQEMGLDEDVGKKIIKVGRKFKGLAFELVDSDQIKNYCNWIEQEAHKSGKPTSAPFLEFLEDAYRYLEQRGHV